MQKSAAYTTRKRTKKGPAGPARARQCARRGAHAERTEGDPLSLSLQAGADALGRVLAPPMIQKKTKHTVASSTREMALWFALAFSLNPSGPVDLTMPLICDPRSAGIAFFDLRCWAADWRSPKEVPETQGWMFPRPSRRWMSLSWDSRGETKSR